MSNFDVLFVGHSNLIALYEAYQASKITKNRSRIGFFSLQIGGLLTTTSIHKKYLGKFDRKKINEVKSKYDASQSVSKKIVLCIAGNEHNAVGLYSDDQTTHSDRIEYVKNRVNNNFMFWIKTLDLFNKKFFVVPPPPPVKFNHYFGERTGRYSKICNDRERFEYYNVCLQELDNLSVKLGAFNLHLPKEVFTDDGYRALDCIKVDDPTHGNIVYGDKVLSHVLSLVSLTDNNFFKCTEQKLALNDNSHPYSSLPSYAYWHQSVSQVAGDALDPVVTPRFIIKRKHKVATAGSCFAQHISKRLKTSGFNYFVAEKPDTDSSAELYDFSARYGNVYTARQLVQLFDRAFGYFNPIDKVWPHTKSGAYCDPFRPRIEPNGFADEQAVLLDRKKHLSSVRRMFKQLDVFVFTLGLTECWLSRLDGAAYPVAPGVVGGVFDSSKYEFVNFGVHDVVTDLNLFIRKLKLVNPKAKIILTVSPVPLVATQEQQHVLVATTYSKSVLRVAADEVARIHDHVQYFPSYEIITGPHASGRYFAADLRSVTEEGVDHVMRVFMSRMTEQSLSDIERPVVQESEKQFAEMEALAETACDEELYRLVSEKD